MTHHKRIRILVLLSIKDISKVNIPFLVECCPSPGRDISFICYRFSNLGPVVCNQKESMMSVSATGNWDCSVLSGTGRETSKALQVYRQAKRKREI